MSFSDLDWSVSVFALLSLSPSISVSLSLVVVFFTSEETAVELHW